MCQWAVRGMVYTQKSKHNRKARFEGLCHKLKEESRVQSVRLFGECFLIRLSRSIVFTGWRGSLLG